MRTGLRLAAVTAALAAVPFVAACGHAASTSVGSASPVGDTVTTSAAGSSAQWWTSDASTHLSPSRPDYCRMLRATVDGGQSLLSAASSDRAGTARRFASAMESVAPAPVAASWRTLGHVVVALVDAGGDPSQVRGVNARAVAHAEQVIAADARSRCGVRVSG